MLTRKELYLHLRLGNSFSEWGELVEGLLCWSLSQSETYCKLGIIEGIA